MSAIQIPLQGKEVLYYNKKLLSIPGNASVFGKLYLFRMIDVIFNSESLMRKMRRQRTLYLGLCFTDISEHNINTSDPLTT